MQAPGRNDHAAVIPESASTAIAAHQAATTGRVHPRKRLLIEDVFREEIAEFGDFGSLHHRNTAGFGRGCGNETQIGEA